MTEQDVVNLKRTIYLTIMSSAGFEEATHKLMKLDVKEPQQIEICNMLVECCSQEKTYMKYYGLIAMRFCLANRRFQDLFEEVEKLMKHTHVASYVYGYDSDANRCGSRHFARY